MTPAGGYENTAYNFGVAGTTSKSRELLPLCTQESLLVESGDYLGIETR